MSHVHPIKAKSKKHTWMVYPASINESCHTYKYVMSHKWTRHISQIYSCAFWQRIRHPANMNESCRTCKWVMTPFLQIQSCAFWHKLGPRAPSALHRCCKPQVFVYNSYIHIYISVLCGMAHFYASHHVCLFVYLHAYSFNIYLCVYFALLM